MELSILIPARNEMFLSQTIYDALQQSRADTEIIAVLDGEWANPEVPQHPRVNIFHTGSSVGMRAATNYAAKIAKGRYLMKVDAHCAFDEGFDRKMLDFHARVGDDVTSAPIMRNLWAFDWKCYRCGHKQYQGPTPGECPGCKKPGKWKRKMIWKGKYNPQSWSYCFDAEPHFQYYEEYKHRPTTKKMRDEFGYTETMSLQGSCFMCSNELYWRLNLSDEALGNWGNQGIEVAAKTWLSGGRVLVNHATWYAHMFRTQGGDFSFPYALNGVQSTKRNVKKVFWETGFDGQKYPLSWLIEKFWPIPGWTEEQLAKLRGLNG
jgi:glycosyltransferase involved in cell wall biosynthesis